MTRMRLSLASLLASAQSAGRLQLPRLGRAVRRPYVLLGALALIGAVLLYLFTRPARPPDVVAVRRGRITASVEASGQVRAAREAWLTLRTGGAIQAVLVKPGQEVDRGDILIQADCREAENQVREAELALQIRQIEYDNLRAAPTSEQIEIARASLRRAAAILQAAQSAYDRVAAEGRAQGSPEAAALESAKLDYETARASFEQAIRGPDPGRIKVAEKNLELARLALEAARARQEYCTVVAPFAGTVVQVNAREGETAYGEKVIRLADLSRLEVIAQVDELDIAELVVGQEAEIRLDALPGQVLQGRVARITPGATAQRGTVGYEVAITLDPGKAPVRPDMTADLRITTLTHDDTLLVPSRAVEMRGRSRYVRVVEGGRIRDVRVTTGLSDGENTEILEGLKEGQQVIVR
ncbi:MAG: efflux RND transporter periplasmic adaptor subunit [Anaerolineae bacterium]|nr:efflux RND transporter periplasmic adaptor subunit [Anaerolineae bacterium]